MLFYSGYRYCNTYVAVSALVTNQNFVTWSYIRTPAQLCHSFRGHPELSSFSRAYASYAGRVKGHSTLFKNVVHGELRVWEERGLKLNIFKVLLVGREGVKKKVLCTSFDNVDNSGRPFMQLLFVHLYR